MTNVIDYGTTTFNDKNFRLTEQAEITGNILSAPYRNYHEVSMGEEYQYMMSAAGLDESGKKVKAYWIFTAIKGEEQELDFLNFAVADDVLPLD